MFTPGYRTLSMFKAKNGYWTLGLASTYPRVSLALIDPDQQIIARRLVDKDDLRAAQNAEDLLRLLDQPLPGSPDVPRNAQVWVSWAGFLPGPITMRMHRRAKASRFTPTACTTLRMDYLNEQGYWDLTHPILLVSGSGDDWRSTFGPDLPTAVQQKLHPHLFPGVVRNHQIAAPHVAGGDLGDDGRTYLVNLAGDGLARVIALDESAPERQCPLSQVRDLIFPDLLELRWWQALDIPIVIDDTTIAIIDLYTCYGRRGLKEYMITYREDLILPGGLVSVTTLRRQYRSVMDADLIAFLLTEPRLALASGVIADQMQQSP